MNKRFGGFRRKQKGWSPRLSKESADAILDFVIRIVIEHTNNKFVRATFLGVASAIIGFTATEPPKPEKIIAAINSPASVAPTQSPDPKPSSPPVVAGPPPVMPRDGDIVRVKTTQ